MCAPRSIAAQLLWRERHDLIRAGVVWKAGRAIAPTIGTHVVGWVERTRRGSAARLCTQLRETRRRQQPLASQQQRRLSGAALKQVDIRSFFSSRQQ